MLRLCISLLVIGSAWACRDTSISVEPIDIETTYSVTDPESGKVIGTVRFNDNGSYLFSRTAIVNSERGAENYILHLIGTSQWNDGVLVLQHTVYQSFERYDRWGVPLKATPGIVAQIKSQNPVPECLKVMVHGHELHVL